MGENSKIEWTDHTFNPWRGCTKIAPGCTNCYAAREAVRFPKVRGVWGDSGKRVMAADFHAPEVWNRKAQRAGKRQRVFCASLADVFEDWQGPIHDHEDRRLWIERGGDTKTILPETPQWSFAGMRLLKMDDLRRMLLRMIDATQWLDWQLVTKRPENIHAMWLKTAFEHCRICGAHDDDMDHREHAFRLDDNDDCWECRKCGVNSSLYRPNVWLLTSVSEQQTAERNIPELLKCRDLCPVLGVSYEPALGPVDFDSIWPGRMSSGSGPYVPGIDWVIAGGESGPNARPAYSKWFHDVRDQCNAAGVAFFFKQWGEWAPGDESDDQRLGVQKIHQQNSSDRDVMFGPIGEPRNPMFRIGKKQAGRLLDGREWNEFPAVEAFV